MPPAWLERKPSGVSSSRCSLPRCATAATPSPISTALTALMPIIACAISASSRSNTGSPSPGGTPVAMTVTRAPTESPCSRSFQMKCLELRHSRRIGTEERVRRTRRPDPSARARARPSAPGSRGFDAEALTQVLARDGAGRHAHHGLARRGTTTAAIVAEAVFLLVGVVGVARTEAVLDLLVVARALIGVLDQQPDRRAGGASFEHAREDAHLIGLAPLARELRGAGATTIDIRLNVRFG